MTRKTVDHAKTLILTLTIALFLLFSILYSSSNVSASTTSYQHVLDGAGVLSPDKLNALNDLSIEMGEQAGIEIYVVTHESSSASYGEQYLEDFNDTLPDTDRVLLLMDLYNREVFIQGYGQAEVYIHSKRIDDIIKQITPDLSDGNYGDAFEQYILLSADYMADDSALNYDHNYSYSSDPTKAKPSPLYNIWVQLAISLGVGGIVVGIMAYQSSGRMTTSGNTYMNQSQNGLIGRRDVYLRTTVSKVRKPKEDSSGGFNAGGFRGGTSSGGRSHSSGSGKF